MENSTDKKTMDIAAIRSSILGEGKWKNAKSILIPFQFGGPQFKTPQEKIMENAIESCTFKAIFSGVIGFGLGAALGKLK